jgi:hypothetical protein
VFSVGGFADRRPVESGDTEDDMAQNRRIDLRFIMVPMRIEDVPAPAKDVQRELDK